MRPHPSVPSRIYLSEISELGKEIDLTHETDWLKPLLFSFNQDPPKLPIPASVSLKLQKFNHFYSITGKLSTSFQLLCSRCADPFSASCGHEFKLLFTKDETLKEDAGNRGHQSTLGGEEALTANDQAEWEVCFVEEDFLELKDILNEQICLALPFQPLCTLECKGICQECGSNLNSSGCSCPKGLKTSQFSSLKKLDLSSFKEQ